MKLPSSSPRDHSIDNVRFILIFSVVFAHLLEVCPPFRGSRLLYQFIYTFHMPAFIFLFGYNASYSPKKIVFRWFLPYIFFQCAYIAFSKFILNSNASFQFTTPYWLLWYMLACIYYQLLLPLFDTENKTRQIITILCAFGISFLIGFDTSVGYYMSLSRFLVFQPWFLLGYYCKKNNLLEKLCDLPKIRFPILFASAAIIALLIPYTKAIPTGLLYGSCSYASCGGSLWLRGIAGIIAFSVIMFLCIGIRPYLRRNMLFITHIGQNTWPVFLLHGFAAKAVPAYFPYLISAPWRVVVLTCVLLILAGNKLCNKAVYYISFSWLEKLPAKTPNKEPVG